MGPPNSSYLSNTAIFHFHDYGRKMRKSKKHATNRQKQKTASPGLTVSGTESLSCPHGILQLLHVFSTTIELILETWAPEKRTKNKFVPLKREHVKIGNTSEPTC